MSRKRKETGTVVYGTVSTVVREDGGRELSSYPIGHFSKFHSKIFLKRFRQFRSIHKPDLPSFTINSELPLKSGKPQFLTKQYIRLFFISKY
jgi:hypothetical protein